MDKLVIGLGPAFAAGFAIQQLLELLDQVFAAAKGVLPPRYRDNKQLILGGIALAIGLALATGGHLLILSNLGVANVPAWIDTIMTGVFISAGTQGFNSLLKFLGYAKDKQAADSAKSEAEAKAAPVTEAMLVRKHGNARAPQPVVAPPAAAPGAPAAP
jgi:hypothetical protein